MKKLILVTALAAVFAGSAMADEAAPVTSGKVTFRGKVTDQTCSITADDRDQTVVLNTVPSSVFTASSKTAMPTPFKIDLTGCKTTSATNTTLKVKAAFTSEFADSANGYALSNQADSNKAEGVFIQLFNDDGTTAITPSAGGKVTLRGQEGYGAADNVAFKDIKDTNMTLHYIAKYYAPTGKAGLGDVKSSVDFNIVYE